MSKPNFVAGRKRAYYACDYVPKDHEARAYAQFVRQEFEREDWDEIINKPRRKRRSLSLARLITHAKQAGADVIINADGSRTIVTCPTGAHAPVETNEWDSVQ